MTAIKISCLQAQPKATIDAAIEEATNLAERTSDDTAMLFLPEYCSGFRVEGGRFAPPAVPENENPMLHAMCRLARERRVWIQLGSIAIPAGEKIFNRGYIIDANGEIRSRYNKIHLFDIQLSATEVYRESDVVAPGDALSLTSSPVGNIGHTICYDLRFPQLYRDLAQAGAQVLAIPAAFTRSTGKAHWHALCRARAIENGAFVVAACAVGDIEGGGGSYGHSLVVDPWGQILADGGDEPGVVEAELDLDAVAQARKRIPSLQHDRHYTKLAQVNVA